MATLSAFYPLISIDCPGVPNPIMDDAIRRGCREFCKLTNALVDDVTITTAATTADYAPTLTATDTEFLTVISLKRPASGSSTTPTDLEAKTQEYIDAQPATAGPPTVFCVLETYPLSLRLFPTPSTIENLTAKFSVQPKQTAQAATAVVNDRLADWYLEGIVAYAKYWLMSQPGKAWSNADDAPFEYRKFDAQVADARVRRSGFRTGLPVQVQMRPFA